MARPTKCTAAVQARLVEAIELGVTYELACQYAGIDYSTFTRWRQAAYEGDHRYSVLMAAVQEAEARAVMVWLDRINQAAITDWRAAAFMLERRYPDHYGRQKIDMRYSGNLEIDLSKLSDAELEALASGRGIK